MDRDAPSTSLNDRHGGDSRDALPGRHAAPRPRALSPIEPKPGADPYRPPEKPAPAQVDLANAPPHKPLRQTKTDAPSTGHLATLCWSSVTNIVTLDDHTRKLLNGGALRSSAALTEVLALIHPEDRGGFAAQLKTCCNQGGEFVIKFRLSTDAKGPRLIECFGRAQQQAAGYPAKVVCFCRASDIVDESRLIVSNGADAEAGTNDVLTRVAHEIRTPLNAILGFSQLLMHEANLSASQSHFVQTIVNNGNDLLQTVADVLAKAKDRSAKPEVQSEPFGLCHFMTDLIEIFTASAKNDAVTIRMQMTSENAIIASDRIKIRRVLVNLMNNALKFTPKGEIVLHGGFETTGSDGSADLRFRVIDTGIGIHNDELGNIFKPYRQLDNDHKEGVGLGLTLCQELIQLLKGTIRVTSKLGEGSVFMVTIPVRVVEGTEASAFIQHQQLPTAECSTVLVGGDNFHNRLVVNSLRKLGHEARWLTDIDHLDSDTLAGPAILLLDLAEQPDALATLTQTIAQLPSAAPIAIIVLCESLTESDCSDMLTAGASTVLVRPITERDVHAALRAIIESKFGGQPAISEDFKPVVKAAPKALPIPTTQLPKALAESMCEAARKADLDGLNTLIGQIEAVDHALAHDLRNIAGQLDYDGLLRALDNSQSR